MGGSADRAVSAVIGAVLLFGFLTIAFAVYQGVVVPNQNQAIEIAHNEQVQGSLQELRNAIRETGTAGTGQSVSLTLGATYPFRAVAVNPGEPAGSLRTESLGAVALSNVSATNGEAADYVGASNSVLGPFPTKALVYRPTYRFYDTAPVTRYEHTVAYNRFPNGPNRSITDQTMVRGRRITLIVLAGNVSAAESGAVTVDTMPLSPASRVVPVTNTDGPINLTLRSHLSAAVWSELLSDEYDPEGSATDKYVAAVRQTGPEHVSILLERGVTYELAVAKVGLGTGGDSPAPRYIVAVSGNQTSVPEGGRRKLVVEVRDRYNNPVSNVSVRPRIVSSANTSDADEDVTPSSESTDAGGRASFVYSAPSRVAATRNVSVDLTLAGGHSPTQVVSFELTVLDLDGSG